MPKPRKSAGHTKQKPASKDKRGSTLACIPKASSVQQRGSVSGHFVMSRTQGRFSETNQSGGVVIVNARTGKAYRDNYEAFLKQGRKKKTLE